MAGIINTGSHPALLWPGIKTVWGYIYKDWATQYTDLVDEVSSDKSHEEYVQVAGFGMASVKPQGDALVYDREQQGATTRLTNVTFALGYMVTFEEIQDNLYEKVGGRRAQANARAMRITKEFIVANMYNRAFTAGYTGGDGVVLCSTAHPLVFGGTQANTPTVAVPLSEAALEDQVISIMGLTDDRGLPAMIMPSSLIVARANLFNAHRILDSVYQNDTANNAVNVLKATNMFPGGIKMNVYLTSPNAWFIRTSGFTPGEGLIYQSRMPATFDQDNDFDTKNAKAASVERYAVGWADWRSLWGVNAS